jgi:hypothetical protein
MTLAIANRLTGHSDFVAKWLFLSGPMLAGKLFDANGTPGPVPDAQLFRRPPSPSRLTA